MRPPKLLAALIALLVLAGAATAQQAASLLADHLSINGDNTVTARGNVEVLFGESRLKASQITFDSQSGKLKIEGPILLSEGDSTIIVADEAELDQDLQNGIISGARLVLDRQLQLAAAEISRVDGRYTQLYKTVASSCQVCILRPVPLWAIRAEKVIHDKQARLLYFEKAQFRIAGVPVFYLPRLRMPDPTLKRANGFLVPQFNNSTLLGFSVKTPYFITLGDHADLTVAPRLSRASQTIELRYRQAFRTGNIEFNGAVTQDDLRPGKTRAYLFGSGSFALPEDFRLGFDLETTSDEDYLDVYGYSGKARLKSELFVTRTQRDEQIDASVANLATLRDAERAINEQLPNTLAEAGYERRFFPDALGGQGTMRLGLSGHSRASNDDIRGRDMTRVAGHLDWGRDDVWANGMISRIGGALTATWVNVSEDSTYDSSATVITPAAEALLRWPLVKAGANGGTMLLEPTVHLAWSTTGGATVPNEDSTLSELDQGNLFALSRFPGQDRSETGLRAAFGVNWSRNAASGLGYRLTFGRVYHQDPQPDFTASSGLDGQWSDWLAAAQFELGQNLVWTSRLLIDDKLDITKGETHFDWRGDRLRLGTGYSYLIADPAEFRQNDISQIDVDGSYDLTRSWQGSFNLKYDIAQSKPIRAGLGLRYRNECVSLDLSLSRRFKTSASVLENTDIGLQVSLFGFGADGREYRRECSGL